MSATQGMDYRRFQPDVLQKVARKQTPHQPEHPSGQLGRQGYRRNPVGQEIICHGRSDTNKDGWCVAISFHRSSAEPLNPIQRPPEIDRCLCTRGARPPFPEPPPRQPTGHSISLQKENFVSKKKKVAISSSSNYRVIKKILFFFSSDVLPRFFFSSPLWVRFGST